MEKRTSAAFIILVLLLFAAACGSGAPATSSESQDTPTGERATFDSSKTTATVSGKAVLEGAPPAAQPIQMAADPYCAEHAGRNTRPPDLIVNADGTLPNVIVYVKSGLEPMVYPAPTEAVTIDQKNCLYAPHILTVRTGQPIRIVNSDATMHNVHAWAERNVPFNFGQPVQGLQATRTFDRPEMPVPIRCDVHLWMNAYAGVFDHPFHTVTQERGTFELKLLPGKYEIEAWHPNYQPVTQMVAVSDGGKAELTFTFKPGQRSATH